MTARTNPAQARVEHLLRSAELSQQHGHHGAAARFLTIATDVLETRKVPQVDTYRARIAALTQGVNA